MTDEREEQLALSAARECAGWNSLPTVPIWAVTPDLHSSFDEVYFKTRDDALEYIQDHLVEKVDCDYTDDELTEDGFTLRLWRKFISQEMYDAVFNHR